MTKRHLVPFFTGLLFSILTVAASYADESTVFTNSVAPNILLIMDNSNSMDEDFFGNGVSSTSSSSKSVNGRQALRDIINTYANQMRFGLMSYRLPSASKWHVHNSAYFASYAPKSYCPNPPDECVDYCRTGDSGKQTTCRNTCQTQNASFDETYFDDIISSSVLGSAKRDRYCRLIYPKTNQITNPTDVANYIYYKQALPYYDSANQGTEFDYATSYNSNESLTPNEAPTGISYARWRTKIGMNDANADYSNSAGGNVNFAPTDSDVALGYGNFGRRMFSYWTGRTWFANSSPGNGYLHVTVADNNSANNIQKNALLTKLQTFSGDQNGYMACTNTSDPNQCSYLVNAGLTPTAGTLHSAYDYFNGNSTPIQYTCQKNFIVYVTDGLPSTNESGSSDTADNLMPAVNTKLDNLSALSKSGNTNGVKTYVLGLGLTSDAKTKLDQMAAHGGTDIDGHAYYADDASQLSQALISIFGDLLEKSYSFATSSVSSTRFQDENFLYEASIIPITGNPMWQGNLKKYAINSDGTVGNLIWDAGTLLRDKSASSRNMKTLVGGTTVNFSTAIDPTYFGLTSTNTAKRDSIVNYLRGESSANPDNWKLGDIFHSNPITVGSPSLYYNDSSRDANNAFATFRANNVRTSANGMRVVITGANDGQIHAFTASDGQEFWSFVPPNLLSKLQYVQHTALPSTQPHLYFVDGSVTVSDAWWPSGSNDPTGISKVVADWHTIAVAGLGRNDNDYTASDSATSTKLWSSSSNCDSGLSSTYSTTTPYYCGYYGFDFSNTLSPSYLWHMQPTSSNAPYLGEPWGRIVIGRVLVNGNEKWVGFVGAGYNATTCGTSSCPDTRGKGFYVVELATGNVIWAYTYADNSSMGYAVPGNAAIIDIDNDGFIDAAYIGDLNGNVWRLTFCQGGQGTSCNTSNWTGSLFYRASGTTARPIHITPTAAKDERGRLWIYWGTGDKINTTSSASEVFVALKESGTGATYTASDIQMLSGSATYSGNKQGWGVVLSNSGEKIFSDPTVFKGVVYFTTYSPAASSSVCDQLGTARLYGFDYRDGGGRICTADCTSASPTYSKSINLGQGLPSAPVISVAPTTTAGGSTRVDVYVTIGGSGTSTGLPDTQKVPAGIPNLTNRTNLLHWKDKRVQ
ncbi:MAG TPA: hypothetical protein VK445_03515 [Dissulfurispiraceae bacterium]|nr:hypothetical protein [Dissulfurispiraceae bacterium]